MTKSLFATPRPRIGQTSPRRTCLSPRSPRAKRRMRAAGALPHVLRYIRDDYHCETCQAKKGPDHRRKAQSPRVHRFNRVLSMDVFYLKYKNESIPVSEHGLPWNRLPTSLSHPQEVVRELLPRRPPGEHSQPPGSDIWDRQPPWQNSRAERHGGWLKQRVSEELDSLSPWPREGAQRKTPLSPTRSLRLSARPSTRSTGWPRNPGRKCGMASILASPCFKTALCYSVVSGCFADRVSPSPALRPESAPERGLEGSELAFRTPESP